MDDAGDAGGPFTAGGNSQCQIAPQGYSAVWNGNILTLALNLTLAPAFAGNRILYAAGRDGAGGNNTGWQPMGTWTVQ